MSDDIEFARGVYFKAPAENAPDFVYGKISLKRQDLIDWLSEKDGEWVNLDVKESRGGKIYCSVDTWKPDNARQGRTSSSGSRGGAPQRDRPQRATEQPPMDDFADDDIPFISNRGSW